MFLHNTATGTTTRVSVASAGAEGNDISGKQLIASTREGVAISSEGHYAAFTSRASNLVPNDTNNQMDVFEAFGR